MKLITIGFVVLGIMITSHKANAYTPEAYPGSFWNSASSDMDRVDGFVEQGNLRQGIQWLTLPGSIPLNTYVGYRWRLRSLNRDFFNEYGPVVGIEFSKYFFNWGLQYEWQTFPALGTHLQYPAFYFSWFKSIDVLGGSGRFLGIPVVSAPFSSWGRVNYDSNYFEGLGSLGYLSQAVEWFKLPADIVFRTQALYYWRFRNKNQTYYNVHGPALGVELARDSVNLGAVYGWEHFTQLNQNPENFRVYFNWFFDWDLKK